jgi:hypothetical protein
MSGSIAASLLGRTRSPAARLWQSKFKHAATTSLERPVLRLLWSGRRDSNPRPPPWQGSWDGVCDLRRWIDPRREQDVFVLMQPPIVRIVSRSVTGPRRDPLRVLGYRRHQVGTELLTS